MTKSIINPAVDAHVQWHNKFKELCYEVFFVNQKGAELLKHLEIRMLKSPVAFPGQESSWAYFNEGQNETIRSFSKAIESYMNEQTQTAAPKQKMRGLK